jgi:hypothetical protein
MQEDPKLPIRINYIFFGLLFSLLAVTSTSSILLKEDLGGSRLFFWFYAIGQSTLEVTLLIFASWMIRKVLGNKSFWFFIGLVFLAFLFHLLDFMMDRVLDLSIWETLSFVFDESLDNFFFLLDASGIPIWIWVLSFSAMAMLPLLGILFYKATHWVTEKKPLQWRKETFFQLFICLPIALFFWDYSASPVIPPDAYTAFIKSLPWKHTFLTPKSIRLPIHGSLGQLPSEEKIAHAIHSIELQPDQKPNIFLFVVESLREDCITEAIAPNLSKFRDEHLSAELALSNANCTQMAWYSTFHSQFPFYWRHAKKTVGSPALATFKKLGYKIHLYSSAQLEYYGMDCSLFGHERRLLDSAQFFLHPPPKEAWESDSELLKKLQADLANDPALSQGQLFIIFWDTTHFDYSWPKDKPSKFTPFASEFSFYKAYCSKKNIEKIKNRYRNAVHFMDSLFGDFLTKADPTSLVAFMGDHGEEFFDHGHLFHNSHLTHEQISVPIYFRIGERKEKVPFLSQMDIMPTLLNAITGHSFPFLQGESILEPKKWPYAVTARYNASRAPFEFSLHNGQNKLIVQFVDRKNIFSSNQLRICALRSCKDKTLSECQNELNEWVQDQFGPALDRLFNTKD